MIQGHLSPLERVAKTGKKSKVERLSCTSAEKKRTPFLDAKSGG